MQCSNCHAELTAENTCCEGGMKCKNCAPDCATMKGEDGKCTCGCMMS